MKDKDNASRNPNPGNHIVNDVINTLFILGYEMFGLNGQYLPDTRNRASFPPVEILNTNGQIMARTGDNPFVIIDKDDIFRLENNGFTAVIPGPKHFDTLVEKVFVRTKLRRSEKLHITRNFRAATPDEKNFVRFLGEGRNEGKVDRNVVKAKVIVTREGRNHVVDVYVHPDYVNNADTAQWLTAELADCMQKESGVFAQAQQDELTDWLRESKDQFVQNQLEAATDVLRKVKRKRKIVVGDKLFIINKGGGMQFETKSGTTFTASPEKLIYNGTMDKIMAAILPPSRSGRQTNAFATV